MCPPGGSIRWVLGGQAQNECSGVLRAPGEREEGGGASLSRFSFSSSNTDLMF